MSPASHVTSSLSRNNADSQGQDRRRFNPTKALPNVLGITWKLVFLWLFLCCIGSKIGFAQPQPTPAPIATFTMGWRNPWASSTSNVTFSSVNNLREVRGASACASVVITNTSGAAINVTLNSDTLSLHDAANHLLTAPIRVIGNVSGNDFGPMFTSADVTEIKTEQPLSTSASAPQFVKNIPPNVSNWAIIKDFPVLHLNANAKVLLWMTIDTGATEWFTDQRTYTGNLQATVTSANNVSLTPANPIPISLIVEGRTSLFDDAVKDTLIWFDHPSNPENSGNTIRQPRNSNDHGASQADYYQDLLLHGSRMYFGWHPDAINAGFRRIVLDSNTFWQQVTTGNDPATGKPWSTAHNNTKDPATGLYTYYGPVWISPDTAQAWATDSDAPNSQHPGEFDRAVANWAQTLACQDAGTFQPYSESYSYGKWLLQIWDEPTDSFALLHQRVAHQIHVYNGAVRIMANAAYNSTVNGTLQVVNPDVTEWWPHSSLLPGALSYLTTTNKNINEYDNWDANTVNNQDSAWHYYRRHAWVVPRYNLSGRGFWSAYAPGSGVYLVYPGPFGPLPTRNWEAVRHGSEDACMVQILSWRSLPTAMRTELDQRIQQSYDSPLGPGANGEPDTLEQNRAWVVTQLSTT